MNIGVPISWAPAAIAPVPALGAYGVSLLVALLLVLALRFFKRSSGVLRGFILASGCTLFASGALYIKEVGAVHDELVATTTGCNAGSSDYAPFVPSVNFSNNGTCAVKIIELDESNMVTCAYAREAGDIEEGTIVAAGETKTLPNWSECT